MRWLIGLLAVVGLAAGINYNDLRVTFGTKAGANKDSFFSMPRTVAQAKKEGWRVVPRPVGPMPQLVLYCRPDDVSVCPLYDQGGFIVGLQVAIPVEHLKAVPENPANKFVKWSAATVGGAKRDYWSSALYFVSEASQKRGPRNPNGPTLQDGGLWATADGSGTRLIQVPLKEPGVTGALYKKQNCFAGMGTHYYYKISPQQSCPDFFHWFMLVKNGEIVGAGFGIVGKTTKVGQRNWFEAFPAKSIQLTIPASNKCLYDWAVKYGLVSLHIYFSENPWDITCAKGDNA